MVIIQVHFWNRAVIISNISEDKVKGKTMKGREI